MPDASNGTSDILDKVQKQASGIKDSVTSEWDYWVAFGILTFVGFFTRFLAIHHPDQVVFDEVHFGKVCALARRSFCLQG